MDTITNKRAQIAKGEYYKNHLFFTDLDTADKEHISNLFYKGFVITDIDLETRRIYIRKKTKCERFFSLFDVILKPKYKKGCPKTAYEFLECNGLV